MLWSTALMIEVGMQLPGHGKETSKHLMNLSGVAHRVS